MIVFVAKLQRKAEELRIYAEKQGLTINKFAKLTMGYCKENNIALKTDNDNN